MLFVISKLFWALAAPANLLIWLLCIIAAWAARRTESLLVRRITAAVSSTVALSALLPIGHGLLWTLEQRFPAPAAPASVDGIIVLGGAVKPQLSAERHQVILNDQAERITEAIGLARQYPTATIVYTGGSATFTISPETEAKYARLLFARVGMQGEKLLFEDRSRNTYENAMYTKQLVAPRPGQKWLLITSARHMPRAIGSFRSVGWETIPWPVDFRTGSSPIDIPNLDALQRLRELDDAMHEWIGLLAYRMAGYSTAVFPGP